MTPTQREALRLGLGPHSPSNLRAILRRIEHPSRADILAVVVLLHRGYFQAPGATRTRALIDDLVQLLIKLDAKEEAALGIAAMRLVTVVGNKRWNLGAHAQPFIEHFEDGIMVLIQQQGREPERELFPELFDTEGKAKPLHLWRTKNPLV